MLTKRLIARLDIKAPNLVKTVRLEGLKVVGDPHEYAMRYDAQGIDEILYLDIVASLYGRNYLADLVSRTASNVFVPITVGGGIRSVEDALILLRAGADKITLNTAAIARPPLITELAVKIGSQCVVVQIDAKRCDDMSWQAWCDGGRQPTGILVEDWAVRAVELGAGEILLTSIDQEGTGNGVDWNLIKAVSERTNAPVVTSGGIGKPSDACSAFHAGASAVAMARYLHFGGSLSGMKIAVKKAGYPVRMAA